MESEEYKIAWNALKNFNDEVVMNVYPFINHFSKRTGHIELIGGYSYIDIYLDDTSDKTKTRYMFSEINRYGWKVYSIERAFDNEIKITIQIEVIK